MKRTLFSELYPQVMADLLGDVPLPVAGQALWQAAQHWARETRAWVFAVDPITLRSGMAVYDLDGWPVQVAQLHAVSRVADVNDRVLTPGRDYTLDLAERTLTLTSTPGSKVTNGLNVKVALCGVDGAAEIETWVFQRYSAAWVHGARHRLFVMDRQPWSNPGMAVFEQGKMWGKIGEHKADVRQGQGENRQTTMRGMFRFG